MFTVLHPVDVPASLSGRVLLPALQRPRPTTPAGLQVRGGQYSPGAVVGGHLQRLDLRRTNVSGADLSRTDLSGVDLSEVDLCRANLSWANHKATGQWQLFEPSPHNYSYLCLQVEGDNGWLVWAGCWRFTLVEVVEHWSRGSYAGSPDVVTGAPTM